MTQMEILRQAAIALDALDVAKAAHKAAEDHVQKLCRDYDIAAGIWGCQSYHLRRACEEYGVMERAA
jgi:hypothetical protein